MLIPQELIKKKRKGQKLENEEIEHFIQGYTNGEIPDYQMAALLMAIYFRGMNTAETYALTNAMLKSGRVLDFSSLKKFKVDKHSSGGVGDKTSLIIGPIVAAGGLCVPMISGRGLGHTGGTLDKLESIPGFNTQLSLVDFEKTLRKIGVSFIGQTQDICPADKKIYALRDVTATVENISLICASIMSKKLAEGIDGLVLDVKFGTGAFMKHAAEAEELAVKLMEIAQSFGKKVCALLTSMDQPLGRFAGNSLEAEECVSIMKNEVHLGPGGYDLYQDTRELSLILSARMMELEGKLSFEENYAKAKDLLESGAALKKWEDLCENHGGDLNSIPKASEQLDYFVEDSAAKLWVAGFDTEKIGLAGILLKAGRQKTTDKISPASGIETHYKIGDPIKANHPLFTIYGNHLPEMHAACELLKTSYRLSKQSIDRPPLILKTLSPEV